MLKKIQYFLPSLQECWAVVLLLVVAGSIGGFVLIFPLEKIFHLDLGQQLPPLTYLLPFIAPLIYLYYSGQRVMKTELPPAPIPMDRGSIGKVPLLVFMLFSWLIMMAIAILTDPLTSLIPMSDSIKELFKEMMQLTPLSILTTVILAPLAEEFLVRGSIARGLFYHTTPAKAIAWSAFFFAIIHMNPWQAIPAFLSGLFLGWIYWRTHSLLACIFIHFINNGTAILGIALFPESEVDDSFQELFGHIGEHAFLIAFIASAFILGGTLYYFKKSLPATGVMWQKYHNTESIENEQIISDKI